MMNAKHNPLVAQALIPSPLGELIVAVTERGVAGLWFTDQKHHPGELAAPHNDKHPHIRTMKAWLDDYWKQGQSQVVVPMDPLGTDFQQQVWKALLKIKPGATSTYGAIAQKVGSPNASRAVGAAVGRNPLGILVPCHRVVGKDGSLTGYAGGLPRKEFLLLLEAKTTSAKTQLF